MTMLIALYHWVNFIPYFNKDPEREFSGDQALICTEFHAVFLYSIVIKMIQILIEFYVFLK